MASDIEQCCDGDVEGKLEMILMILNLMLEEMA